LLLTNLLLKNNELRKKVSTRIVIDQGKKSIIRVVAIKRVVLRTTLFLFLLVIASGLWLGVYILGHGPVSSVQEIVVNIPRGASVKVIAGILGDAGLIYNDPRFLLLARISGYSGRLQAGEFLLTRGKKPGDVIKELVYAKPVQHAVTIIEGLRASEIAQLFERKGWCDTKTFLERISNKEYIRSLGVENIDNLEGYLYPDTYLLTANMKGAEIIIAIMVKRFSQIWEEITAEIDHEVSRKDIVVLASIVEKEAAASAERPLIAGVFANRLTRGMRLQSDPTVVYGLDNFSGKITKKQLRNPTPYNTYTLPALPAGPICNPGKEALRAALHPAETQYLYFVAKNDGTHHFSASLTEHNRAVRKYQRKKKTKDVK